jgi:hypothetical protein
MLRCVALVRTDVSEDLVFLLSERRLVVTASVVPSSLILVTVMKEALSSSETSVVTRETRRNITEDAILGIEKLHKQFHIVGISTEPQLLWSSVTTSQNCEEVKTLYS